MKKLNNKAFTVVELIITFAIVMTISLGLFKVIDSYRSKQEKVLYKKELLNYRDEIIKVVKDDMYNYGLKNIGTGQPPLANIPSTDSVNQSIKITFKNDTYKYLYFGQTGCTNHQSCTGKYYIKYDQTRYTAPSNFIVFENDVMYSCDSDVSDVSTAIVIVNNTNGQKKTTRERDCKINIRMRNTEIKDEVLLRMSSLVYSTTNTNISNSSIQYNMTGVTEIHIPNGSYPTAFNHLNTAITNNSTQIKKVKIICGTTTTVDQLSYIKDWTNGADATLIIGSKCTQISDNAFSGFTGIKTLAFEDDETNPSALTKIGKEAFYNVPLSGNLVIPRSFVEGTSIGARAFYGNRLNRIVLQPESVNGTTAKFKAGTDWNKDASGNEYTPIVLQNNK